MDKDLLIHIITRLEPGGSAQNVIDSVVYQARERRVLLIAGPYRGAGTLPMDLLENAEYTEVPELVRNISPLKDLKALFRLKKLIEERRPAIVHTHTSKAGILGRLAAWLANRGIPDRKAVIVHTPHGHVFYGYFGPVRTFVFKGIERLAARITDHFIALTEGEMKESIAGGLGKPDKWEIIHSGLRFKNQPCQNAKKDLGIEKEELVIAVVARLEPVKGVEYFIRAAAELLNRGTGKKLRFLVVGDGALRGRLEALAAKLGTAGRTLFAGFQRDVYKYLAASDIYVQPSLNEAMGRTVLEAQYMKLPVVASAVCGLPDAVRDGVTGLLVPPADPQALAGAVEALIRDDQLRCRMREAARRSVLEKDFTGYPRFSAESMNIQLKKFYNKVLAQHGRG